MHAWVERNQNGAGLTSHHLINRRRILSIQIDLKKNRRRGRKKRKEKEERKKHPHFQVFSDIRQSADNVRYSDLLQSIIENKIDIKCTGLIFESRTIKASCKSEDKVLFLGKCMLFRSIHSFWGGDWTRQVQPQLQLSVLIAIADINEQALF